MPLFSSLFSLFFCTLCMFKTIYGLAFKKFFVDYVSLQVYYNKYNSKTIHCGWFLLLSKDKGKTWEECKYIITENWKNNKWSRCLQRIWELERAGEVKQRAQVPTQNPNPNSLLLKFPISATFKTSKIPYQKTQSHKSYHPIK